MTNSIMAASHSGTAGLAAASSLNSDTTGISIVIRFSGNQSYNVDINAKDKVRDLKKLVARQADMSPRSINFVLGGQLLCDDSVLENCGLGAYTTLHAFCWSDDGLGGGDLGLKLSSHREDGTQLASKLFNRERKESGVDAEEFLTTFDSEGSDVDGSAFLKAREEKLNTAHCSRVAQQEHHRFFVFCNICNCIRPAKLRLSCFECGGGAFLVERGPSNWDDISSNTTIKGTCKTQGCNSTTPRFYLRCSQNHEGDVEGTVVVLKHVQSNHRRVECIICGDIMSHILIFPCSPGHVICLECFRQYGSSCLSERRLILHPQHGYTLPCPAGCDDSHIEETHHFILLGPEKYEQYKMFGAEEYVLQNGGILCPAPGCGMGLFPEGNGRLVKCRECLFESCKECRRAYHIEPCEENIHTLHISNLQLNAERAQRACWETQSISLIEETTKPCPGCQIKTERTGGCMHMTCVRCHKEWCWICGKLWNRDCQAYHWFG